MLRPRGLSARPGCPSTAHGVGEQLAREWTPVTCWLNASSAEPSAGPGEGMGRWGTGVGRLYPAEWVWATVDPLWIPHSGLMISTLSLDTLLTPWTLPSPKDVSRSRERRRSSSPVWLVGSVSHLSTRLSSRCFALLCLCLLSPPGGTAARVCCC